MGRGGRREVEWRGWNERLKKGNIYPDRHETKEEENGEELVKRGRAKMAAVMGCECGEEVVTQKDVTFSRSYGYHYE